MEMWKNHIWEGSRDSEKPWEAGCITLCSLCMQAQSCHIRPVMLSALQISTKYQAMLEAEINEDTQEDGFLDLSAL